MTEKQIGSLTERAHAAFAETMRERLHRFHPDLDADVLQRVLDEGPAKARGYGFHSGRQIAAFLHLMGSLGVDFDSAREKSWAARLLAEPVTAEDDRIERLLEWTARELQERESGPRGRGAAVAFEKAWSELDSLTGSADPPGPVVTKARPAHGRRRPTRVEILEGPLLDWVVAPGEKTASRTLHALGTPPGGYFEWMIANSELLELKAAGAEARIEATGLGECQVAVRYTASAGEAHAELRVHLRAAACIHVSPGVRQFGTVPIGEASEAREITITNVGGSPLTLGTLRAPRGFALGEDRVSGRHLPANDSASFKLILKPQNDEPIDIEWQIPCNAHNQEEGCVQLQGRGQWPRPVPVLVGRADGEPLTHVGIGQWNRAWNAKTGLLYNRAAENHHFIGRDRNRFHIRVTDARAAAHGLESITADWWVCRDRDGSPCRAPASAAVNLRRLGSTNHYLSPSLMLVTDEDDYRQATHAGPGSAGLVQAGEADHRLRLLIVDERDRLDHHVRVGYPSAAGRDQIVLRLPVFCRQPDERRTCRLNTVRLRTRGPSFTTAASLKVYSRVIRTLFARLGIYVAIADRVMNPPPAEGPGPGAVELDSAVVTREGSRGKPRIVPAPSQLTIARNGRQGRGLHLYFVASLIDPLTGERFAGQAFDADRICRDVSPQQVALQWQARSLARRLAPEDPAYATPPWTEQRRARLARALTSARAAAAAQDGADAAARAFLAALAAIEGGADRHPHFVRQAISRAREQLPPAYSDEPIPEVLAAVSDCAFLAGPDQIDKYAPAHQLAHLLGGSAHVADTATSRHLAHHLMAGGNPRTRTDPVDDPKRLWPASRLWSDKAGNDPAGWQSACLTAYEVEP